MQLQENTIFDDHYTLIRQLGRGGFSEVWLAHDSYMDLDVVLKIYAPGHGMDKSSIDEFRHEIKEVFNLNHSNLLKPQYLGVYKKMPYLVLSYCRAGSVSTQIGKFSEEQAWKLIHDVASGLAYLHKNDIVHQDIKPDNILLDDNGNYVITDFGISTKARSTLRKSAIGGAVLGGTMAYMGPERFSKQPAPTKASDIWSFGAMVYELITGNVPFGEMGGALQKGGAEIPEINEPLSDKLRQTIESMLALETWDRPTAEQLAQMTADGSALFPKSRTTQRMVSTAPIESAAENKPDPKIDLVKIFAWAAVVLLIIFVPLAYYWSNSTSMPHQSPPVEAIDTLRVVSIEPEEANAHHDTLGNRITEETPIMQEPTITPPPPIQSGNCGDNLKWSFDPTNGELKITGTGKMTDWVRDPNGYPQWHNVRKSIKTITLPDGLVSIGVNAFYQCSNLKYISIPNSVTYICGSSFSCCSSLRAITIPYGVASLDGTFFNCTSLSSIILPNSITWIGGRTFKGCKSLKSITLSDRIRSVEYEAFLGCTSLTSITIPNSVKYIGVDAFKGCSSLREIKYPADLDISAAGIPSSANLISYERKND